MIITLLCKVVDNFGDIGVVYRLANRLSFLLSKSQTNQSTQNKINLVVDDLISFNRINHEISPSLNFQVFNGINVINWNAENLCYDYFKKDDGKELGIILECFQCGRPDWMEKILFQDKLNRTVQIIMIDYLTAEAYAQDFHCLMSLTRSSKVKKVNFMPGFTSKTGGLTLDKEWETLEKRNPDGNILVFTYERNWKPLALALKKHLSNDKSNIKVQVAQGRGLESFKLACENTLELKILEYLNQDEWDRMMKNCSVLFIRGEESLSRACLSGIPFVWHAYPQSDEYQLVKVKALLERMKPHFSQEHFELLNAVWLDFNTDEKLVSEKQMEQNITKFLCAADEMESEFKDFAFDLRKNGDLASNLMTYIKKIDII